MRAEAHGRQAARAAGNSRTRGFRFKPKTLVLLVTHAHAYMHDADTRVAFTSTSGQWIPIELVNMLLTWK